MVSPLFHHGFSLVLPPDLQRLVRQALEHPSPGGPTRGVLAGAGSGIDLCIYTIYIMDK
jgi:hypothetical protein